MIVPIMGTSTRRSSTSLADALFSPVQQRVLGLLFGQPERRYQSAELIRLASGGTGAVHRIVTRLAKAGLITAMRVGNQKYYQANKTAPVFAELNRLLVKTVGIVGPLERALAPKAKKIAAAFVYGSVAKRRDTARSDIDLMVITDSLGYPDLYRLLRSAESSLGRTVNPSVMSPTEWRSKRARSGSFVARVAAQPRLFVIGSDDELS